MSVVVPETPTFQQEFDRLGPWTTRFQIHGRTVGGSYEVSQDDPLLRTLVDHLPSASSVLELGCMEGGRTFPLARRVGHVVGVDARREHLQRARFIQRQLGVSNTTFLETDLDACELATLGTFDVIYNAGLLYHLADPSRLLMQCAEVAPEMLLWTHVVDDSDVEYRSYRGRFTNENPSDCIGGLRSRSFRPERSELLRMLSDSGWRDVKFLNDQGTALTLWCRTSFAPRPICRSTTQPSLAVIITCHNYGKWLDECLRSVLFSSRRPDEVIMVDDASDDDTEEMANHWSDWGVRYLRVEHRNVRLARLDGLNATKSEFVCFVDADDRLSPDYLRSGLQAFDRHDIGFVYSDADRFGDENSLLVQPSEITLANMSRLNHVHNGAIVRREALEMSRALEVPADPCVVHEDWLVWRRILDQGWQARKQRATYGYRRHPGGVSVAKQSERPYFDLRGLAHETITLFVPLSGRTAVWPRFQQFLEQQTWPHNQVKLVLMDNSQDGRFGRRLRRWISQCDYRDVRYFAEAVSEPRLADADRRLPEVQDAVRMAAARIYNLAAREVTGTFLWIVEDDVIPPNDAAELLMCGFDHTTASVAGPYPSRFHEGYVAWTEGRKIIKERGEGITPVEGNGFGCTIFRVDQFRDALFTARQQPHVDFDPAFYERQKSTGLKAKLCWDAECEHLENDTRPIMTWDHWPESWETTDLTDYCSGFLTGRDACQWIVDTLNGPEPAAIWGLSDGDIAWWCYDALSKLPGINQDWLDKLAYTSGLHPKDRDELWPLFDEACRNSQHWLVQYGWDIAERLTHAALKAQGVGIEREGFRYASEMKTKMDCNAVYKLIDEGLWWPLLEGKRLAVVGGHADDFASRLMDAEFVKSTGVNDVTWSIAMQTTCPDKSVAKLPTWNRLRNELFDGEWDLLLCSAGSLSAIICEHARHSGRCAIDIGALDQRLISPLKPHG